MHRLTRSLLVVAVCSITLIPLGCGSPLTASQRLADFDYLYGAVLDNYPFLTLLQRTHGFAWADHYEEYRVLVEQAQTDASFARAIELVLCGLRSEHADIVPGAMVKAIQSTAAPVWLQTLSAGFSPRRAEYWRALAQERTETIPATAKAVYLSGEYVVAAVCPAIANMVELRTGWVVESVRGVTVLDYVESHVTDRRLRWDPILRQPFLRELEIPYGESVFRDGLGNRVSLTLPTANAHWASGFYRWPAIATGTDWLFSQVIDGSIGYLYMQRMAATPTVARDLARHLSPLIQCDDLIIDIRGNPGGSGVWALLVHMLTKESLEYQRLMVPRASQLMDRLCADVVLSGQGFSQRPKSELEVFGERIPPEVWLEQFGEPICFSMKIEPLPGGYSYGGRIWLLVDDGVYSNAAAFAAFCTATGWATVVGTPIGGEGVGLDPLYFMLPNSGMVVRIPSVLGLNPDGSANAEYCTMPDVVTRHLPDDAVKLPRKAMQGTDADDDRVLHQCLDLIRSSR
ncbi:MAG: S41 family peptidase [bacterium]|nr:S41 family peptidase [bacterium]